MNIYIIIIYHNSLPGYLRTLSLSVIVVSGSVVKDFTCLTQVGSGLEVSQTVWAHLYFR